MLLDVVGFIRLIVLHMIFAIVDAVILTLAECQTDDRHKDDGSPSTSWVCICACPPMQRVCQAAQSVFDSLACGSAQQTLPPLYESGKYNVPSVL